MRPLVGLIAFALPLLAAPVPKGMKAKRPSADGLWQVVAFNGDNGQVGPGGVLKTYWRIDADRMSNGKETPAQIEVEGCLHSLVGRDPDRPHLLELKLGQGGSRSCALEVDGDTLRWAWATDPVATVTECKPAAGVYYYEFKRVAEK
jgi:hypothetical protein